jgi:transcriptional regulator GlxA family with amidase domain
VDFVLVYPQAPVETDLYMSISDGFTVNYGSWKDYALHLINNLYGQKQARKVWNDFLTEALHTIGFTQSKNDPCMYWRTSTIIIIYTDDTIVSGPVQKDIDQAI